MVEEVLPLGFIVERPRSAFNNCFVVDHGWRAQNCRASRALDQAATRAPTRERRNCVALARERTFAADSVDDDNAQLAALR